MSKSKLNNFKYNIKKILKFFKVRYNNRLDWKKIIPHKTNLYKEIQKKSKNGKKILIATGTGGFLTCSHFDSVLGVALNRYGANVEFLLCDEALPACQQAVSARVDEDNFSNKGPKSLCEGCFHSGRMAFDETLYPINYYSKFISDKEIENIDKIVNKSSFEEIKTFRQDDINIGEHALAGTLRYYSVGDIKDEPKREIVLKRFFKAALITKKVSENLFKNKKFDSIILHHGIYVPQGIILQVANKNKIKVITYSPSYRKKAFMFSPKESYEKTMMNEPVDTWRDIELNNKVESKLMNYLTSRRYGHNDWTYYFKNPNFDVKEELVKIGVDINKPIISIIPNIIWDAQMIYPNNIFKNMLEWLFETLKFFENKDIQVIVRSHPGEINSERITKQQVKKEILKKYLELPKNFFLIGPESSLSTYGLVDFSDTIIIYATKMGMEYTPFGANVIVGGESYVKNKGFTYDPKTKDEYFKLLKKLPLKTKLSKDKIELAKKYAYHFFFRRSIEVSTLKHTPELWPNYNLDDDFYKRLLKKEDRGLDRICNSIINDEPFVYKDEIYLN